MYIRRKLSEEVFYICACQLLTWTRKNIEGFKVNAYSCLKTKQKNQQNKKNQNQNQKPQQKQKSPPEQPTHPVSLNPTRWIYSLEFISI